MAEKETEERDQIYNPFEQRMLELIESLEEGKEEDKRNVKKALVLLKQYFDEMGKFGAKYVDFLTVHWRIGFEGHRFGNAANAIVKRMRALGGLYPNQQWKNLSFFWNEDKSLEDQGAMISTMGMECDQEFLAVFSNLLRTTSEKLVLPSSGNNNKGLVEVTIYPTLEKPVIPISIGLLVRSAKIYLLYILKEEAEAEAKVKKENVRNKQTIIESAKI